MKSLSAGGADRATADALDRFWDGLSSAHLGGPSRPDELLEPSLTRSVRQLRLVDEAPRPEPAFAAQLWTDLMTGQAAPVPTRPPAIGLAGRLSRLPRHRFLVELMVAAALLLVVLGGGSALKLPVSLDPVAPTVAASAAVSGTTGFAAIAGCAWTVTPEPTRVAVASGALPAPTMPPATATRTAAPESC